MNETAEGDFTANVGQFLEALQSLEEHLGALQDKFANAGPGITSHLQGIDDAATRAAQALQGTAAGGAHLTGFFDRATAGFHGFIGLLTEVSHWTMLIPSSLGAFAGPLAGLAGKISPLGPAFVAAFGSSLPHIKHLLEQVSVLDRVMQAATGHLGPLGAAFGYMAARAIGASRAVAGIGTAVALAVSASVAGMRIVGGAIRGMAALAISSIGAIGTALSMSLPEFLPLIAGVGLLAAGFAVLKKSVSVSADFETTVTSFRSLVGNAEMAKKAISDLIEFSDKTPFNKFEITEAGRQLVAFGFAADNLLPILTDVGDLAAGMNKPLADVGSAIGRLKSGQFGEAFQNLRGFGVTRMALEAKGLKFDASGQYHGSVEQAMDAVRGVIHDRFGGAMEDLSKTWSGLWSTLVSKVGLVFRAIGEPILEQLKPMLAALIDFMHEMLPIATMIGIVMGEALRKINDVLGFKPVISANRPDRPPLLEDKPMDFSGIKVGKLRELGGGGAFHLGLGNGGDPLLDENRRHTRLLETIAQAVQGPMRGAALDRQPVPVEL